MRTLILDYMQTLRSVVGKTAPYLLIELLLPGGTLFALLLFLYRRRRANGGSLALPHVGIMMRLRDEMRVLSQAYGLVPARVTHERDGLEALGAIPLR